MFQEKTQFQQTQCEELTQLREENQHLTIQLGAERASVETIGGGENLLTEKAAGIQTGIITGARKREGSAAGGGKPNWIQRK